MILLSLALPACAPGPNEFVQTGSAAGFWYGLWHGIIAPVTFVISLFNHDVGIYEVHNVGRWYDLGFVLGIICFHGGAAAGRNRRRKSCEC
jgi:hypothetical protein